jgi:hypothetical protein
VVAQATSDTHRTAPATSFTGFNNLHTGNLDIEPSDMESPAAFKSLLSTDDAVLRFKFDSHTKNPKTLDEDRSLIGSLCLCLCFSFSGNPQHRSKIAVPTLAASLL